MFLFLIIFHLIRFEFYKNAIISPANISFLYHFYTLLIFISVVIWLVFKKSTWLSRGDDLLMRTCLWLKISFISLQKRRGKTRRPGAEPKPYFTDVEGSGGYKTTTVVSHAQMVVLHVDCSTGGKAKLTRMLLQKEAAWKVPSMSMSEEPSQ